MYLVRSRLDGHSNDPPATDELIVTVHDRGLTGRYRTHRLFELNRVALRFSFDCRFFVNACPRTFVLKANLHF